MFLAQKRKIYSDERIISTREFRARMDLRIKSFSSAAWIIGLVIGSSGWIANSQTWYRFAFLAFHHRFFNSCPPDLLNPLYFPFLHCVGFLICIYHSTTFEFDKSIKPILLQLLSFSLLLKITKKMFNNVIE